MFKTNQLVENIQAFNIIELPLDMLFIFLLNIALFLRFNSFSEILTRNIVIFALGKALFLFSVFDYSVIIAVLLGFEFANLFIDQINLGGKENAKS